MYHASVNFVAPKTGEEITNANPTDTNVNDIYKSPKFSCYILLWLRQRNGKKNIIIIYKNNQSSDWTEKELIFTFQFVFPQMLLPKIRTW